jgi:hypothetical protein
MQSPERGAVMKRLRRNHTAASKAKVALAALKDDKALAAKTARQMAESTLACFSTISVQ